MKKIALLLITFASCTDESATMRTLKNAGYTDIKLTGHSYFTCGNDSTCTGFEATGPTGAHVTGAVGCGVLGKGCTIRFE